MNKYFKIHISPENIISSDFRIFRNINIEIDVEFVEEIFTLDDKVQQELFLNTIQQKLLEKILEKKGKL